MKRRIEEKPTARVSILYDQQVKKFRRDNGSAGAVPVFDRVKSSIYEYRAFQHPQVPKSLSKIDVPERLTRTLMGQSFLFCNNRLASIFAFASPMAIRILGKNEH